MHMNVSDCEVRIKGDSLIQIQDGKIHVHGKSFHEDIKNISTLIGILSDIVQQAEMIKKPKLVFSDDAGNLDKKNAGNRQDASYKIVQK